VVEDAMLDQLHTAIVSIPGAILALLTPPAIWARAAWASPYSKTHRHGVSGSLSILAGLLMGGSLLADDANFPVLLSAAAIALIAMFSTLLWPKQNVR
jgi:hypothetical protein